MKKVFGQFIAAVLTGLIPAKTPFYSPKDVVFEPGLLGIFAESRPDDDVLTIQQEGSSGYRLTFAGVGKTTVFDGRLLRLSAGTEGAGDLSFFDLTPHKSPGTHHAYKSAPHEAILVAWDADRLTFYPYAWKRKGPAVQAGSVGEMHRFLRRAVRRKEFAEPVTLSRQPK